ncbi:MAG: Zn-dependent hydrolase [Bacteroidetes bacterium]|nr:Zn-dependent hydrolase [Bacteroidota bacterium]
MVRTKIIILSGLILIVIIFSGCGMKNSKSSMNPQDSLIQAKINEFAVVKLTTDLNTLTAKEKEIIPLLIEAAEIIDGIYWKQTIGDKKAFMDTVKDSLVRQFARINYGPWERLNGNKPFITGFGEKPAGANFYPKDMTKEEFEKCKDPNKASLYTIIRRGSDNTLKSIWYHEAYKEETEKAASLLAKASALAEDPGLKKYLELRSKALLTDDYLISDMAWMDMKTNTIDVVIGPIENYEDELFGYKTAYEGAILVKDKGWSKKLEKFAAFLPELQANLPVDAKYKKEKPGTDSDLNAYDLLYVSGQSNAGSKTIAINLPNDERVQLKKGSRRLQLKNAMKAKFENILMPIAIMLIDSVQRSNVKFDAFFSNVMFHEVAHGLGLKNTVNGQGNVREALKEQYSSFEEAKADILGLFMTTRLIAKGEIQGITIEDCYVTYMASLIRSVRFGAASAHGKANMMCLNFFEEKGAFDRNDKGSYKVNFGKMKTAVNEWAAKVLIFEGDGDYEGAKAYVARNGKVNEKLASDLGRLRTANIPVDIVYEQGLSTMGLK